MKYSIQKQVFENEHSVRFRAHFDAIADSFRTYGPSSLCSKGQAHLMPGHAAMGGAGQPFVDIAEAGIEGNLRFLAGEDDSLAAVGLGIGDETAHHEAGQPLVLVVGMRSHAKDHLPVAGVIAKGGGGEHLIHQVSLFGDGAVDERNKLSLSLQHPEMMGVTA